MEALSKDKYLKGILAVIGCVGLVFFVFGFAIYSHREEVKEMHWRSNVEECVRHYIANAGNDVAVLPIAQGVVYKQCMEVIPKF